MKPNYKKKDRLTRRTTPKHKHDDGEVVECDFTHENISKNVIKGRKLKLWDVPACRKQFDCNDAKQHTGHIIISKCCDQPMITHFSNGELILMCMVCLTPEFRIQVMPKITAALKDNG
jgi:hypothetical protein